MPTHGRAEPLRRCLEALGALRYPGSTLEVVVVDDASPEPVRLDPAVAPTTARLVRTPRNLGPAAARNLGAREARGEILLFTDDDCRPEPEWAETLGRALAEGSSDIAGGITVNGLAANPYAEASQDLVTFLYGAFDASRSLRPFFTSNNLAVRRPVYMALGGFDETFRLSAGEDRDFCERWCETHGGLRFVPEARVVHYHALTLRRFLTQHFRYGRGAIHLARLRASRGLPPPRPEPPGFYGRMLAHPFQGRPAARATALAGLVALSQVAGLAGMVAETIRPRNDWRPEVA